MGTSTGGGRYVFTCPECGAEVLVDAGAREALLDASCVLCGAEVTPAAFRRR